MRFMNKFSGFILTNVTCVSTDINTNNSTQGNARTVNTQPVLYNNKRRKTELENRIVLHAIKLTVSLLLKAIYENTSKSIRE